MPSTHASRLIFRQTGKPAEVLEIESFTLPALQAGEVLVRLLAAPINPADLNTIEGNYGVKLTLPATPGIEGCGVVEASEDIRFAVGDRVTFLRRAATWASHTIVTGDALFKLPLSIDRYQAAMLKVNPATAWQLLHGFQLLDKSSWVVQNAGNSAVGRCVIQLARDLGIQMISFVRRPELAAELHALGAKHVFTDDDSGFAAAREILGGANATLASNAVGGDSALRLMKLLTENGIHITYGAMARKPVTIPNGLLIFRNLQLRGLWITRWLEQAPREEVDAIYQNLAEKILAGKLTQLIDSAFPISNFREAFVRLDAPDRSGKVLFGF